jgi:hypothetical protein
METSNVCTRKTFKWQHLHLWKTHDKFTIVISCTKSNKKMSTKKWTEVQFKCLELKERSKVKKNMV